MSTATFDAELADLYHAHARGLLRYAFVYLKNHEAAEDAVQEVFLKYYVSRVQGHDIERPERWLFGVIRNYLLDQLKAPRQSREIPLETLSPAADSTGAFADPESAYQAAQMLQRTWDLLSPREIQCLRLRTEGLSYEEIAEVLELRPGTVGTLLARAQKRLHPPADPRKDSMKRGASLECDKIEQHASEKRRNS